jgi:hypothetical protein
MKYETKKMFRNVKERIITDEIKKISEGLNSPNGLTVAITFDELRRLKDRWHVEDAKTALSRIEEATVISAINYLVSCEYPLSMNEIFPLTKKGERIKKALSNLASFMLPEEGCELLTLLLNDPSSAIKIQILKKISKSHCPAILDNVKALIEDKDFNVKLEAMKVLYDMGENVEEEKLTEIVYDIKLPFSVRKDALKIHVDHSQNALKVLGEIANSPYPKLSESAISLMAKFPCDQTSKLLEPILSNGSLPSDTVKFALKSAAVSCNEKSELEQFALKYLEYPSNDLKITSLKALMAIESQSVPAVIEEFLEGDERSLKLSVIPFVELYPSKENIDFISDELENGDEEVIEKILKVFRKLRVKDERIRDCLLGHSLKVRVEALKVLISTNEIDQDELINIFKSESSLEMKLESLNGILKIAPDRLEELV